MSRYRKLIFCKYHSCRSTKSRVASTLYLPHAWYPKKVHDYPRWIIFVKIKKNERNVNWKFIFSKLSEWQAVTTKNKHFSHGNVKRNFAETLKWINLQIFKGVNFPLKFGHSPSKKIYVICVIESLLKMTKNAFFFILKAFFVLKILSFCLDFLVM